MTTDIQSHTTSATKTGIKALIKSKTFWANTLALLSLLIPAVQEWIIANQIEAVGLLGCLNVALKVLTGGKEMLKVIKSKNILSAIALCSIVASMPSCGRGGFGTQNIGAHYNGRAITITLTPAK